MADEFLFPGTSHDASINKLLEAVRDSWNRDDSDRNNGGCPYSECTILKRGRCLCEDKNSTSKRYEEIHKKMNKKKGK